MPSPVKRERVRRSRRTTVREANSSRGQLTRGAWEAKGLSPALAGLTKKADQDTAFYLFVCHCAAGMFSGM